MAVSEEMNFSTLQSTHLRVQVEVTLHIMQSENPCKGQGINSVLWYVTFHFNSGTMLDNFHTACSFLHLEISFYGTTAPSGASIL